LEAASEAETPPTPGEKLLQVLQEHQMSQTELCQRTGRPKKTINEIIKGKAQVTAETAIQFQLVLGVKAEVWTELEAKVQERRAFEKMSESCAAAASWLEQLPHPAMETAKWIPPVPDTGDPGKTAALRVVQLLEWFGVASPEAWHEVYIERQAGFRRDPPFAADPGVLAAWMRTGELQAGTMRTAPYDRKTFQAALQKIRALTVQPIAIAQDRMIELAAAAGVAVTWARELGDFRVAGLTRWLSPRKALIHLSLAGTTDDQVWLTFFHQAGHLLLHGKKQVYLEGASRGAAGPSRDDEEAAADEFATQLLAPAAKLRNLYAFCQTHTLNEMILRSYAAELGIAPGIVVARLQQLGWLAASDLNHLKQRLEWAPPGTEADPQVY
ncbi:MAG: helix-turn-helix domain-containing protein, partial [Acidobacteriota bacterium]